MDNEHKIPKLSVEEIQLQTIRLVMDFPIKSQVKIDEGKNSKGEDVITIGTVDGYTIYPSLKNYCVGLKIRVPGDVVVYPPEKVRRC